MSQQAFSFRVIPVKLKLTIAVTGILLMGGFPAIILAETNLGEPPFDGSMQMRAVQTGQTFEDRDFDGIADDIDQCNDSVTGYPVRANGCPVLKGVLKGVNFKQETNELTSESFQQLYYLANLLMKYPTAKIQIWAHTDDSGSLKSQSIITRQRLRVVGTYLVQQGIPANRLVLRSMGAGLPLYDNLTPEGRTGNNRIEILEQH